MDKHDHMEIIDPLTGLVIPVMNNGVSSYMKEEDFGHKPYIDEDGMEWVFRFRKNGKYEDHTFNPKHIIDFLIKEPVSVENTYSIHFKNEKIEDEVEEVEEPEVFIPG